MTRVNFDHPYVIAGVGRNFNCAAPTNKIFSWGSANLVEPTIQCASRLGTGCCHPSSSNGGRFWKQKVS